MLNKQFYLQIAVVVRPHGLLHEQALVQALHGQNDVNRVDAKVALGKVVQDTPIITEIVKIVALIQGHSSALRPGLG